VKVIIHESETSMSFSYWFVFAFFSHTGLQNLGNFKDKNLNPKILDCHKKWKKMWT